jgi:uncharacterized membrane protein
VIFLLDSGSLLPKYASIRFVALNSLMATLHHIAAFAVAATLVYEFVAFRKNLTVEETRRILRVDAAYGISAAV